MRWMRKYGFRQSRYDPCMFFGERPEDRKRTPRHLRGIHYVPILVDDISTYIADSDLGRSNYRKFIEALNADYPTVDMGQIEFYLKQAITTDPETKEYSISQEAHVQKMLKNSDMSQCKSVPLPFSKGLFDQILKQGRAAPVDTKSDPPTDATNYRSALGSCNFPAVMTRPDISNTVSVLQRFQQNPRTSHLKAVKHLQKYLQGTKHYGICYDGSRVQLSAKVDAAWADDVDTAESQYGWVVMLCGGPVSWKSGLQRCTATSSTEAEYVALADLVCELLFLTGLLTEMGYSQHPVAVDEDNTGVFGIAKGEGKHSHRRHINIKYHLCQKYLGSLFYLNNVRGSKNIADIMTKSHFTESLFVTYRDSLLTPIT